MDTGPWADCQLNEDTGFCTQLREEDSNELVRKLLR